MADNWFDQFAKPSDEPRAPRREFLREINGLVEAPPPAGEDDYGLTNDDHAHPFIEVLPPEFADDALALNFSAAYGHTLRFVSAWSRWFRWDGKVWRHDDTLQVYDLCRLTCRSYATNATPQIQRSLTSGKTIASVEKLIRSDRRHAATVNQWDADPWLLNTPAGIIDLRTREMIPHDPLHHMTKCTAVSPGGDCPLWLQFLDRVTDGNVGLVGYLKRVCGYCLTGIISEHAMFFAFGTGRNGKGVFLNTITAILADYAMTADPDTFTAAGAGKHLTVLARLQGSRLVVAQETEEGTPWAEARIKSITGGDPITANYMRQDHFTYNPAFKLFVAGNHKPGLRSVDEAIKARLNLIPFAVTIPREERDPDLVEKLRGEFPGILAWMIEGCWDWQHARLSPPPIVSEATGDYFEAEDAIGLWMADCCRTGPFRSVGSSELYGSWTRWAKAAGEDPRSQKRFSDVIASRGFASKKSDGRMVVQGIDLIVPKSRYDNENDDR